jgi:hypothetical protein
MSKQNIYLILALLGIVLPYTIFLPWLFEHGIDVQLFFQEFFANGVSTTTALDFMMVSVGVITFIIFESKRLGMKNVYISILATLVAVGFGLALFLFMRERHYARESD